MDHLKFWTTNASFFVSLTSIIVIYKGDLQKHAFVNTDAKGCTCKLMHNQKRTLSICAVMCQVQLTQLEAIILGYFTLSEKQS